MDAGGTDAGGADAGGMVSVDAAWASFDPATQQALLDQLANGVVNNNLVGAAMGLASADGTLWAGASGLANVETMQPWEPTRSFRIGSVTKTFTAALIFLLEADGALTLDDPLEQWVPGFYDGVGVTLRHLMSNTSGIVSYNYVGSFDSSAVWTPTALVQWAVDHEPALRFAPGSQWEYSNTNWVLLGLVIEAAGADTYEALVAQRLTLPLGLTHTYIAGADDDNPAIVECYAADRVTNMTQVANPSFGWAAGAAVSTPADLARWAVALYGGAVLPESALTRMVTPTVLTNGTVTDYGMGAFLELDGEDALYGHTGGYAAYFTYMYYWKRDRLALVVMSNTYDTNLRDLAAYGWSVPLGFMYP